MTFEETYQKYLDESDPDYHPSMESLFKWFFDAGRSDGIAWAERFTAEQCIQIALKHARCCGCGELIAAEIERDFKVKRS